MKSFGSPPFSCMILSVLLEFFVASCATKPQVESLDLSPQFELSNQYFRAGSYDKACALLEQIAARYPASIEVALGLGNAYYRLGDYEKAEIFFRKANQLTPGISAKLGQAKVELVRNNAINAQILYDQILREDPNNLEALNGLGVALDLAGQHDRARAMYEKAQVVNPLYKNAANNLALSLALDGQAYYAASRMTETYRSNTSNKTIRQNLALIQHLNGKIRDANTLATLDLSSNEAKRNFEVLSSIFQRQKVRK
ncbi:tetratricopeptide repeat protein [Phyllobacterium salinisoli]|uniref:Tetratricopeptide repeat protein n=1 Tax=Phyllobacterium salinisoli TaxID=1899321 RepID=A0A368JXD5_9HYPH|nr:tetratricopeptide repeat protein [Phyllobacterium salinisoli]RCS21554.1 tetratricopeptide repeat protein [Phyllobacterium salinisoli]